LGIVLALAVDADIILMDAPFSSVDEQTRRKFQEELLELLRHNRKTVIFVTRYRPGRVAPNPTSSCPTDCLRS
jgi:ABC-type proline/glycine betaine transport system ATPase subunit